MSTDYSADTTYVIGSEGSNTLTVTNTKNLYGGFVVNKVVAGNDPDKKSWFAVKISLNDKTITGQYGDVYFVNGESYGRTSAGSLVDYKEGGQYYDKVYNDKVPAGYVVIKPAENTTKQQAAQPIVVWGLPEGVIYTVEEADYSLTYDKSEITGNNEAIKGLVNGTFIPGTTEVPADAAQKVLKAGNVVTVTNTRNRFGKLKIEKHVQDVNGNEVKDTTQSFDFCVTLKDSNDNPITGTFNNGAVVFGKNGTAVVSVQAGQYVEILGLPLGAIFTVEELDENPRVLAARSGVTGFEAASYELWYADSTSGSKPEKRGTNPSGTIDVKERTVKVINKEESVEVEATKAWQDADGKNIAPKGASVTFALYADGKNVNRTITLDGSVDQNGESTAWVANFGKLPKYSYVNGKATEIKYTIQETSSLPGYVTVNNKVENNGTITNKITSVKIQKIDGSGSALPDAHLQILDQGNIVDEWDTDGSVKTITGLNYGHPYTIRETKAPEGYQLAPDTTFTIKSDGTIDTESTTCAISTVDEKQILTVTDFKNIKVLKTDDSGNALSGAALEIDDENDTPIERWTSDESAHVIETRLEAGKKYTLKETATPAGYSTIAATAFRIGTDGSIAAVSSSDGKVTVQEGDTFQLNAKDTYSAEGSVTISASKKLTGAKLRNGQFTFLLKYVNGITLQSKKNDATGAITFDPISYSHSDVANSPITYQVTEQNDGTNGFTYDSSVYTVQVTLADDGKGNITATPVYYKGDVAEENKVDNISFANTYSSEGSTMIQATKNLIGNNLQKDEFSFSLTGEKVNQSKTNEADGKISFDKITYNQDDITTWNKDGTGTGIKTYKLKENKGDLSYIQYDSTEYIITVTLADDGNGHITTTQQITKNGDAVQSAVFGNVYTSDGTVIIRGSKTLKGGMLRENEFSFLLEETDANGNVLADGIEKTAVNDAAGNFYFDKISYTQRDIDPTTREGVKYYKVTEVNDNKKYVKYDVTTFNITVTLKDNGEGHIETAITYGDATSVSFTNKYQSSGSTSFSAHKNLTGKKLEENEFNFTLKDDKDKIVTAYNEADGSISFGKLKYTQDDITTWNADGTGTGTKTYTISEAKGTKSKVTYDAKVYTVVVTLQDDGKGIIDVSKQIQDQGGHPVNEAVFNNTYNADGTVTISGSKELRGRKLQKGEFTFELRDTSGAKINVKDENGNITTVSSLETSNSEDGSIQFPAIAYTLADIDLTSGTGTKKYTVSEKQSAKAGIKNDDSVYTVIVTLTLNDDGLIMAVPAYAKMSGNETESSVEGINFENVYTSTGSILLKAGKKLNGLKLQKDWFTFIVEEGDKVVARGTNNASGAINFTRISYTQQDITDWTSKDGELTGTGNKTYTIREVIPEKDEEKLKGVTYDTSVYTVNVKLSDNGAGAITANVISISKEDDKDTTLKEVEFVNNYASTGTIGLHGVKKLAGRPLQAGEFTFTVSDQSGKQIKVMRDGELTSVDSITASNAADGSFTFEDIYYTQEDVDLSTGRSSRIYTVKEAAAINDKDSNGITNDSNIHSVKVVLQDTGKGTIKAEASYVSGNDAETKATFRNTYTSKGSLSLSGSKTLHGRTLEEGEFTFKIQDAEGKTLRVAGDETGAYKYVSSITAANTAGDEEGKGTFTFQNILYTQDDITEWKSERDGTVTGIGHKTYKVTEVVPNEKRGGVTYDTTMHTVSVTLMAEGDTIKATIDGDADKAINFTNTYEAKGALTLMGTKKLSGNAPKEGLFSFKVVDGFHNNRVYEVKNEADGTISYPTFNYTLDDVGKRHTYTISEEKGTADGIKYDETVYTINVDIADNGDGTLAVMAKDAESKEVTSKTNNGYEVDGLDFNNGVNVLVNKYNIIGDKQVANSTIEVWDVTEGTDKGTLLATWTSDGKEPENIGDMLRVYHTYMLKEILSPVGYAYAQEVIFSVNNDGTLSDGQGQKIDGTLVRVKDSELHLNVSKVDATTGKEVEGAKIQILDETGKVVDEWTSDGTSHDFGSKLEAGKTYTFHEDGAPAGYAYINDVKVTINKDGTAMTDLKKDDQGNYLIEDEQLHINVSKVDATNGKELSGAKIQILDETGKVVDEWISGRASHDVGSKLEAGKTYTLHETVAPDGYDLAEQDTTFSINKDGTVNAGTTKSVNGVLLVEDQAKKNVLAFDKVSMFGMSMVGAKMAVIRLDAGGETVKDTWTTNGKVHQVEGISDGSYVLRELAAPSGFTLAPDVVFTVRDGKAALKQAENGRLTTVGSVQVVVMTDATQLGVRDQRFAKIDEQGRFLPGAELQITTEEGNVIAVWTTGGAEHTERLIGGNYILTETKAPAGYQVADPIRFTVNEKGFITSIDGKSVSGSTDAVVTMTDKKIAAETETEKVKKQEAKGVKTGDDTPILPMTMALAVSALAVLLILSNKRKKEKQ